MFLPLIIGTSSQQSVLRGEELSGLREPLPCGIRYLLCLFQSVPPPHGRNGEAPLQGQLPTAHRSEAWGHWLWVGREGPRSVPSLPEARAGVSKLP